MKPKYETSRLFSLSTVILASAFCASSSFVYGGQTWDASGGANTNSNLNTNWNDDVLPSGGGSTGLVFASNGNTVTWNGINLAGTDVNIAALNFTGNAFTINSGTQSNIQIVRGAGSNFTAISNTSANLQTINPLVSLFYNGTKTFDGGTAGGASLALNGGIQFRGDAMTTGQVNTLTLIGSNNSTTASISESAGFTATIRNALTKNGTGKWTVTGNATYSGATTVTQGTMEFQGSVSSSRITNNAALIFNSAGAQSYSNNISGTGTLTKQGAGQLTLGGIANSYTGATTISGGTLEIQGSGSYASSGITNDSALIFNNAGNQTYNNNISGSGSLTKQGAGTLTLSGANSYLGATTITGGTLKMGYSGAGVAVTNGSFESNAGTANNWQATAITGWTGGSGIEQGTSATFAPVSGVTGLPNYNASTNFKWAFQQLNAAPGSSTTMTQTITVGADGYYTVGFSSAGRSGSFGPLNVEVLIDGVANGTVTPSQTQWNTYSSNGTYLTAGTHTLAFNFINALGGDRSSVIDQVSITGGATPGSLAPSTTMAIASGATFDMNGTSQTVASLSDSGGSGGSVINSLASTTSAFTISNTSGSTTFSGVIGGGSGTLSLTKSGDSTQILSGANTYTGATSVTGGILKAGVASVANVSGAFGNNSAVSLANTAGVALDITGFNTQIGSLTGGGLTGGNVTLGAATLTVGGNNTSPVAYAGVISSTGAGGLTKIGSGTLTLSGANTYTGATNVTNGTLAITGAGSINNSTSLTVSSGATFRYNSSTTLTIATITNNGGTIAGSGSLGAITLGGTGSVDPGNSPGILTVAATDPSGGLDYNFEMTAGNILPTWSNSGASVNDVLRLTGATPFTSNLGASNTVSIYFGSGVTPTIGDVFTGGFFTDNSAAFLSAVSSATFQYFVYNGVSGTLYNGTYYDAYAGPAINVSTVQIGSASFSGGPVINGYVTQFTVVPETSTTLLGALGALAMLRRRRH